MTKVEFQRMSVINANLVYYIMSYQKTSGGHYSSNAKFFGNMIQFWQDYSQSERDELFLFVPSAKFI